MHLPPDDHRMQPGHAPTPFSASQIRDACRPGRAATYRLDVAGEGSHLSRSAFVSWSEEGADVESVRTTLAGDLLGEPTHSFSRWEEFQAHASYPEEQTAIDEETMEVAGETFTCWRYTVTTDGGTVVAWFAQDLPGAPIAYEQAVDGSVVFRMTLSSLTRA